MTGAYTAEVGRPPHARREPCGLGVGCWPDRLELPNGPVVLPGQEAPRQGVIHIPLDHI
jgi:hypothetical protein